MPFQVQYTNTPLYSGECPDFEVWVATLSSSVLADYPECAGKTPSQVLAESNEQSSHLQSETLGENTLTQVFASQAEYDQSVLDSYEADLTKLTPAAHMRKLYREAYPVQVTITKTTI